MNLTYFPGGSPMNEAEFLALGETPERVELVDGGLLITVPPNMLQRRARRIVQEALRSGARRAGLDVAAGVGVRLRPDLIPTTDLVISGGARAAAELIDAADVRLVCEILSPTSVTIDTVLKKHCYAAAKIPWYLVVEPVESAVWLYRLDGDGYTEQATARPGEFLEITEPVHATIDPMEIGLAR
jgi:Uma2 family endonuclease